MKDVSLKNADVIAPIFKPGFFTIAFRKAKRLHDKQAVYTNKH